MSQTTYKNYRVRVEWDDDSQSRGWDGCDPLDPSREWKAFVLFFEGQCEACDSWHDIDCIGGVWASDDKEGFDYLLDSMRTCFDLPSNATWADMNIEGLP